MTPSDSNQSGGIVAVNLREFFSQLLFEAAKERRSGISPLALNYTSQLLVNFSETQNFFAPSTTKLPVLADMLAEAVEADFYRRVSILRRLGDTSLMISGYFFEAVEKRIVDRSYYTQMGETAYAQLSQLTEDDNVFDELSSEFVALMNVLTHMADKLKGQGLPVSEVLDQYKDSKKESLLQILQNQGVYPFEKKETSE